MCHVICVDTLPPSTKALDMEDGLTIYTHFQCPKWPLPAEFSSNLINLTKQKQLMKVFRITWKWVTAAGARQDLNSARLLESSYTTKYSIVISRLSIWTNQHYQKMCIEMLYSVPLTWLTKLLWFYIHFSE